MNRLKKGLLAVSCICCVTLTTGCSVTETVDKIMGKTNEAATKDVEVSKKTDGKIISNLVSAPEFVKNLEGSVTYTLGAPSQALQVEAVSPDGGTVSYQWYRNNVEVNGGGEAIEGAVSASYIPDVSEAGSNYYYVLATNTVGDGLQMSTSGLIEVVVLAEEPDAPAEGDESLQEGGGASDEGTDQPSAPGE